MGEEVLESKKREGKASSTLQTQYITFSSAHALPKALVHGGVRIESQAWPRLSPLALSYIVYCRNGGHSKLI